MEIFWILFLILSIGAATPNLAQFAPTMPKCSDYNMEQCIYMCCDWCNTSSVCFSTQSQPMKCKTVVTEAKQHRCAQSVLGGYIFAAVIFSIGFICLCLCCLAALYMHIMWPKDNTTSSSSRPANLAMEMSIISMA